MQVNCKFNVSSTYFKSDFDYVFRSFVIDSGFISHLFICRIIPVWSVLRMGW
jgi:hypothetical protein